MCAKALHVKRYAPSLFCNMQNICFNKPAVRNHLL